MRRLAARADCRLVAPASTYCHSYRSRRAYRHRLAHATGRAKNTTGRLTWGGHALDSATVTARLVARPRWGHDRPPAVSHALGYGLGRHTISGITLPLPPPVISRCFNQTILSVPVDSQCRPFAGCCSRRCRAIGSGASSRHRQQPTMLCRVHRAMAALRLRPSNLHESGGSGGGQQAVTVHQQFRV